MTYQNVFSLLTICDSENVFEHLLEEIKCLQNPGKPGLIKIASDNQSGFAIGQWISDYNQPNLDKIDHDFSTATGELHNYQTKSLNKSNCAVNSNFWFTANCSLEANTELFVHYGFQYWLKKFMLEEKKNPEKRFFYYSLNDQSTQIFNLQKFYEYDDETCITFLEKFILMPKEIIQDKYPNVKELLFELSMKNVDLSINATN